MSSEVLLEAADTPSPAPEIIRPGSKRKTTRTEDAAVGSISHILRTLFRQVYDEEEAAGGVRGRAPATDEDPDKGPWYGSFRDITEGKTSERAKRRIEQIEGRLNEEQTRADGLLEYISDQISRAKTADKEEERELKRHGLLVNVHIPMGGSHLRLDPETMARGGGFSRSLVSAAGLVEDNERALAARNGIDQQGPLKARSMGEPGFLRMTNTNSIRRELALRQSRGPRGDKKAAEKPMTEPSPPPPRRPTHEAPPPLDYDQLDLDSKILARMDRKLNYLRNPRYDPANPNNKRRLVASSLPALGTAPPPKELPLLIVEPPTVAFENYELDDACEMIVCVRNASAVSRRLRLLRPATRHFRVLQLKWPGARDGDLAPGMALRFVVRFFPSKLSTYEDVLTVVSESGEQRIPLRAACEPSLLTLPAHLDLGARYLGAMHRVVFDVENKGGPGTFRVLKSQQEEEEEEEEEDDENFAAALGDAFTIKPARFELERNARIVMEVVFAPSTAGEHQATFSVVSDNAPTAKHSIVGHADVVSVSSVRGDDDDDHLVVFAPVLLGSRTERPVDVINTGKLPLEFEWVNTDGFGVEPLSGTLVPNERRTVLIVFSPRSVEPVATEAAMIIKRVPRLAASHLRIHNENDDVVDVQVLALGLRASGSILRLEATPGALNLTKPLVLGGSYELVDRTVTIRNPSVVAARWRWTPPVSRNATTLEVVSPEAMLTSASLSENVVVPPNNDEKVRVIDVSWNPSDGTLGGGESVECTLKVVAKRCGDADLAIGCSVALSLDDRDVEYEAARITLAASVKGGTLRFLDPEINFGLVAVNTRTERVLSFVNDTAFPLYWSFAAVSIHADATYLLDYDGKPRLQSDGSFAFEDSLDVAYPQEVDHTSISFEPREDITGAGETGSVRVICNAGADPALIRAAAVCRMRYLDAVSDKVQHVGVRAQVDALDVRASPPSVDLGIVYNGVLVERDIALVNVSDLPTAFEWEPNQNTVFNNEFSPAADSLAKKETRCVRLKFTAHCLGIIDETFHCVVAGMTAPLKLSLKAVCKAAVLAYEPLSEDSGPPPALAEPKATQLPPGVELPPCPPPPKLDFGNGVPLFERRTMRFVIRNLSAIPISFRIKPNKYPAATMMGIDAVAAHASRTTTTTTTKRSSSFAAASSSTSRPTALLGEAYARQGESFKSASGRAYLARKEAEAEDSRVLRDGKGVAFRVEPDSGTLVPWGVQVVCVTAFNNMAGSFHDNIECAVHGMPIVRLPVKIVVSGCALSLRPECVGLDVTRDGPPLLSFGQQLVGHGVKALTRKIRIKNAGPVDAQLVWRVGPDDGKDDGDNDRIVDVALRPSQTTSTPLDVTVRWHDEGEYAPPFTLEPATMRVPAHGEATLAITLPPEHLLPESPLLADSPSQLRALIVANAEWLKQPAIEDSDAGSSSLIRDAVPASAGAAPQPLAPTPLRSSSQDTQNNSPTKRRRSLVSIAGIAARFAPSDSKLVGALKVRAQALLIVPRLELEREAELDGCHVLRFTTSTTVIARLSEKKKKKKKDATLRQRAVFRNPSDVELALALSVTTPFSIAQIQSTTVALRGAADCASSVVLGPRQSMTVELVFEPATTESAGPSEFDGTLTALFATGQTQVVRLRAHILRPALVASPPAHQFGLVRVSRSAELVLFLSNPTEVVAAWQITHIPRSTNIICQDIDGDNAPAGSRDEPRVFEWDEYSGAQRGPTMPLAAAAACLPKDFNRTDDAFFPQTTIALSWKAAPSPGGDTENERAPTTLAASLRAQATKNPRIPRPVVVTFRPADDVQYCSRFRFEVADGQSFDVVLQGTGTYAEDVFERTHPHVGR